MALKADVSLLSSQSDSGVSRVVRVPRPAATIGQHAVTSRPPNRLSPRVMIGVELNILKSPSGSSSAGSSRHVSPVLPRSGVSSSRVSTQGSDRSVSPPPISSGSRSGKVSSRIENQLEAYLLWINSQLKKKPGARLVEDLRNDARDGVAFVDLISVIAGETIAGVHDVPSTYAEMKENVERILQFMSSKKIRMHHIMAKDIVDGNLKSIMRLILALAAHYKPKSVKQSSQGSSRGSSRADKRSPNVSSIAQGAAAALTAARRHVAKAGNSFRRKGHDYHHSRRHYHNESSSDQYSDSDTSFHADHPRIVPGRERGDVDGASAGSSPNSSTVHSPPTMLVSSTSSMGHEDTMSSLEVTMSSVSKSKSADYIGYKDSGTELEDSVFTPAREPMVYKTQYDDLMGEYLKLAEAMTYIKKDLGMLQDLLLSGQPPDGAESGFKDVIEGTTPEEQIVVLRSQLQQSHEVCSSLREELSRNKLEMMQIQGIKAGLQQRISDQENNIATLKSELLRRDFQKQNFDSEQANFLKQLQDKDKLVTDLKKDIARRDQRIDHLQHELQMQVSEKENATRSLKLQVKELSDRFRVVDETGASLRARLASQDEQMARLAGRILHTKPDKNELIRPPPTGADKLGVLQESLSSLRRCFSPTDPQQHTLDTIEQGISTLVERLPLNTSGGSSGGNSSLGEPHVSRKLNFDGTGDVRRSPITAIPGSRQSSFHPNKLGSPPLSTTSTKVLYFKDNSTTPSMLTINKRLGEITLHDFKGAFERPNQYRFHFKALDPEFGTVKEEISNEDAIIPGWEGKIVAWVEPDTVT
ncbi:dixin-like isoform X2 [Dreissena polymorpha]|uniref:dixin-like isoform X2 n=1 Tax=Dreissena polymorpha TaxID=45954 RepID=UPI00226476BC|nr:dixin-like isoform X2 [Dreissena polymorpha]